MLVTIVEASAHLRRDTSDDDADLTLKIHAASGAVLDYIRGGADSFTDSSGEPILDSNGDPVGIPYVIKAATLLWLGDFYSHRSAGDVKDLDFGFPPRAVVSLLTPYRDPSMA